MTHAFRRGFVGIAGALILASILPGCSGRSPGNAGSKAAGTSGSTPVPIHVQITSLFVTVENRAGQPLLDIEVAIRPVGRAMPFTTTIQRMESGERRDLSLGDFVAGDNTTRFSLRIARPKEVAVTAVDLVGQHYEMTVPWDR